jgi:hypothetical protein
MTALIVGFCIRLISFMVVFIALLGKTESFLEGFRHWDSWNYQSIGEHGYALPGLPYPESIKLFAFYPALPIVYSSFANILKQNTLFVALFINTIFFLSLCRELYIYLYREYEDKNLCNYIFLCYLLFPFSWFLQVNYTETIFLWLTLLSINLIHIKKVWLSHLAGFFAGFTRSTAFATAVGNWIIYTRDFFKNEADTRTATFNKTWQDGTSYILKSMGFLSYGIGTLTLLAYFQFTYGDWHLFFASQKDYYGRQINLHFWQGWLKDLTITSDKWFTETNQYKFKVSGSENFVDYLVTLQTFNTWLLLYFPLILAFIGSAYLLYKKQYDKLAWSWPLLIMPIMTGETTSINRYLIVSFPLLFSVFELTAKNKITKLIWLVFSVLSWVLIGFWFSKGFWVG